MARLLGLEIPERIDGIGLMQRLLAFAETNGFRVFLLGAKTDVLEACVAKIRAQYPALRIAGFRNGYFSADEAEDVAREVAVTQADIVFLGMGSPMKEFFADRHAATMGVPVVQGVGGSFDVIAGQVPRAPVWLQRLGLEWLFRVVQEPRRMFWRYAKTNSQCLVLFVRAWLGRSKSGI